MKEGTQRATKGSVEEGVGWGGGAARPAVPCVLPSLSLSLSSLWLSLVAVAIFVCFSLLTN